MPTADHRQPPTAQWLTNRYLTDRLTAEEIAELSGWSSQYIRGRLRDHGIPLRPPGTHHRIRRCRGLGHHLVRTRRHCHRTGPEASARVCHKTTGTSRDTVADRLVDSSLA